MKYKDKQECDPWDFKIPVTLDGTVMSWQQLETGTSHFRQPCISGTSCKPTRGTMCEENVRCRVNGLQLQTRAQFHMILGGVVEKELLVFAKCLSS